MAGAVFVSGSIVAVVLLALLVATVLVPRLRIWPTPGEGSLQSYVFWPLFRGLNALCITAAATAAATGAPAYLGLPSPVRGLALALLVAAVGLFVYAFRMLGRDNSYGAQDGLVTAGIYQWSRNPQNAMLVAVYGLLGLTADDRTTYLLCAAMMAVYTLMILAEEPWLAKTYGAEYRRYCATVPRFFNWQRAIAIFGRTNP